MEICSKTAIPEFIMKIYSILEVQIIINKEKLI
jgi:hypothetical protein